MLFTEIKPHLDIIITNIITTTIVITITIVLILILILILLLGLVIIYIYIYIYIYNVGVLGPPGRPRDTMTNGATPWVTQFGPRGPGP